MNVQFASNQTICFAHVLSCLF